MSAQSFDFCLGSFQHRFEVDDKLSVNRVVCGSECVECSRTCPVEDAQHGEVLGCVRRRHGLRGSAWAGTRFFVRRIL